MTVALPVTFEAARGTCRDCQAGFDDGGAALFPVPGQIARTICGVCQGKRNRSTVESTRAVIRDLKAAVAVGNNADEFDATGRLIELLGPAQAHETARAIRAAHEEPSARGGRR